MSFLNVMHHHYTVIVQSKRHGMKSLLESLTANALLLRIICLWSLMASVTLDMRDAIVEGFR